MKTKRLTVIVHYSETWTTPRSSREVVTAARCLSVAGSSIPWTRIVRQVFVQACASLFREVKEREQFAEILP